MIILTGPTASGKNTVGGVVAKQRERCAVIDSDMVRAMVVQPHRAPWQGEEGHVQQLLGVHLVCTFAERLALVGWEVIVLDVVSEETAALYRQLLQRFEPTIVQLLPAFPALQRRFDQRGPVLTDDQCILVNEQQCAFTHYDIRIDNTDLPSDGVAKQILNLLGPVQPSPAG